MVRVSNEKQLVDIGSWFPGYGENRVEYRSADGGLTLEIFYDKDDPPGEVRRTVSFLGVVAFTAESMPSPQIKTGIDFVAGSFELIGSLIEFERSGVADAWRAHFGGAAMTFRHFSLTFTHANKTFDIIASGFEVGDEMPIA